MFFKSFSLQQLVYFSLKPNLLYFLLIELSLIRLVKSMRSSGLNTMDATLNEAIIRSKSEVGESDLKSGFLLSSLI